MLSKRKLRHLAAGLLGTFISRYNDYEGYWAFGVMYREVYSSGNPVTLDLIAKTALPDMPATASVSRTYGNYLREAIAKFGDPRRSSWRQAFSSNSACRHPWNKLGMA